MPCRVWCMPKTLVCNFSCLVRSPLNFALDALISASWDRTIRLFDPRAPTPEQSSHENPERIYHIDLVNNTLVVAMASRLFHIYDIRNMQEPSQRRESSLKYMTRSLACMANGEGTACHILFYELYWKDLGRYRLRDCICRGTDRRRIFWSITGSTRKEIRFQMSSPDYWRCRSRLACQRPCIPSDVCRMLCNHRSMQWRSCPYFLSVTTRSRLLALMGLFLCGTTKSRNACVNIINSTIQYPVLRSIVTARNLLSLHVTHGTKEIKVHGWSERGLKFGSKQWGRKSKWVFHVISLCSGKLTRYSRKTGKRRTHTAVIRVFLTSKCIGSLFLSNLPMLAFHLVETSKSDMWWALCCVICNILICTSQWLSFFSLLFET